MGGQLSYRYRRFGAFRLGLAFLVVLQHFTANAAPLGFLYDNIVPYELGSLAVLVFFCLSGFVITEAVTRVYSDKPVAYLTNRFLRIMPHFIVAIVVAVIIHAVFHHFGTLRISNREHPNLPTLHAFDFFNIAGNAFAFLPGVNRFLSFSFVDIIWAVRVEMVFYFAVFLILLVPSRLRSTALLPYVLVLLGLATIFVSRQFGFGFFFMYGVLLFDHQRFRFNLLLCTAGMSLYFFLIPLQTDAHYPRAVLEQYLLLIAMIGAMTWLASRPGNPHAFDQRCGELSYPLYIHHQNVLILMISLTTGYSYPVFAIGVLVSLAASYGLMQLVDPTINQLRNIIRGGQLARVDNNTPSQATAAIPAIQPTGS